MQLDLDLRKTLNSGRRTFTLQVRAQAACAMEGDYAVLLAGHAGDTFAVRAATLGHTQASGAAATAVHQA